MEQHEAAANLMSQNVLFLENPCRRCYLKDYNPGIKPKSIQMDIKTTIQKPSRSSRISRANNNCALFIYWFILSICILLRSDRSCASAVIEGCASPSQTHWPGLSCVCGADASWSLLCLGWYDFLCSRTICASVFVAFYIAYRIKNEYRCVGSSCGTLMTLFLENI